MKHASRLLSLLVIAAAFVVLTGSCDQNSAPARAWDRGAFRPMSENTKSYSLPSDVTVGTISSHEEDWPSSFLPLYMTVSNSTGSDVQVTFPAGLVFGTADSIYQYMMLLQEYVFTVASGANLDTVVLSTFCGNEDLDEPDYEAVYTIRGQEWDKETQELLDLLAPKSPVAGDDNVDLLQEALFEITDYEGLTDSTKTQLQSLP
jgi:hypothetical protein